jgi:hypothetical protein
VFKLVLYSLNSTVMPQKSESAISCIQNLGSNAKKQSPVTIEDVEDEGKLPYNRSPSYSDPTTQSALEDYSLEPKDDPITIIRYLDDLEEKPLPDPMSEIPDQDSDLDMELDNEFEEITEVSDLERFANTLAEAQRVAVQAEDWRLKEYNCPKHYLGNSARTKRHHKQIGRELKAKEYHSIKTWFAKQKESSGLENAICNADADDCEEPVESSPGTGLDSVVDEDEDP